MTAVTMLGWLALAAVATALAAIVMWVDRKRAGGWDPSQSGWARWPLLDKLLLLTGAAAGVVGVLAVAVPWEDCGNLLRPRDDSGSICGDYHLMSGAVAVACGITVLVTLAWFYVRRRAAR